jgi:hypothetical protein
MMKRLALLLFALLLVADLAEDGCIAKARLVSPHSAVKVSVTSSNHGGTGNLDSLDKPPPATELEIPRHLLSQIAIPLVHHYLKHLDFCNTGSSGGIPL